MRSFLLAACLAPGCAYESVITAARVPVPVLVGPVSAVGGAQTDARRRGAAFDVKVDHTYTVASSSNGYTTTTTTTHIREGAGKVDAAIRRATDGQIDHAVHVDEIRVRAFSSFIVTGMYISSRVRLKGAVGRALQPMPKGWTIDGGGR